MATRPRPGKPQPVAKQGIVTDWREPDESRNRPGKMVMDDESWEVAWWPDDLDALDDIDLDTIIGKTVLLTVRRKGDYNGKEQYNGVTVSVQGGGAPPPRPPKATQAPASKPAPSPTSSPKDDHIMLQNAFGHVTRAYRDWMHLDPQIRGTFSDYLKDIAMGATWVLHNLYHPLGYAPQRPTEAPEPNVEPEPDIDYQDEDDTASNMGVMEV
jgi:hypothetical protein